MTTEFGRGYNIGFSDGAKAEREKMKSTHSAKGAGCDPTDPGYDVDTLREHVRHLERRVRQLSADRQYRGGDVDERAAFEAWKAERLATGYGFDAFDIWQARAALSAQPAATVSTELPEIPFGPAFIDAYRKHYIAWGEQCFAAGAQAAPQASAALADRQQRGGDVVREFIDATDALLESKARKSWNSGYVKDMTPMERGAVAERWRQARAALVAHKPDGGDAELASMRQGEGGGNA